MPQIDNYVSCHATLLFPPNSIGTIILTFTLDRWPLTRKSNKPVLIETVLKETETLAAQCTNKDSLFPPISVNRLFWATSLPVITAILHIHPLLLLFACAEFLHVHCKMGCNLGKH